MSINPPANDNSVSGFIVPADAAVSPRFEEITSLPCKGFNALARARRYGRWWMLKGLKKEYRGKAFYETLLRKEFDILVSLQHPGIVAASGFEVVEGLGECIVMEWVDGVTLAEWLADADRSESRQLAQASRSIYERLAIVGELLDALEYIHKRQLVHRDLKPSNIMVTRNGHHVKLIDFGLSDTDSHHVLKQPAGTSGYISPEQATMRQTDQRNDIYSLGCVLEQLALGKRYAGIIRRCKAPIDERFGSVQEVRLALERQTRGKKRWMRFGAVLVVVVLLTIATILYIGTRASQPMHVPQLQEATADSVAQTIEKPSDFSEQSENSEISEVSDKSAHIADGKKAIDELWNSLGVEATRDTIVKSERFYRFINESNALINHFPSTLPASLTESERSAVTQSLSAYAAERYVVPTLKAFQDAQE